MNFLNPMVFWLLGFILVPIIIHFINQFNSKKVRFSTIRFLKSLESSSIRRFRLKELFLLFIRILIIILLIVLFSRPVTKGFLPEWISSNQETMSLLILDNSASMNKVNENISNVDLMKSNATAILSSINPESRVIVYQTCPPRKLFDGLCKDPNLKTSILSIKSTSSFDNIWNNISLFIKNETNTEDLKECLVFSDFMHSPVDWEGLKIALKKKWKFYFIYPEQIKDNIAINSVTLKNRIKTINQLIKLDVKLLNSGYIEKKNIPLELVFDDQRVGQVISDIDINKNKGFLFQAYPTKNGIIQAKFHINEDDYSLDNQWDIAIPILEEIRCAIIGNTLEDIEILKILLNSIDPNLNFIKQESRIQPNVNRLFLDQIDVVILNNINEISAEGVKDLEKFISKGGGVIWFQGDDTNKNFHPSLYENLDFPKTDGTTNAGDGFFSVSLLDESSDLFKDIKVKDLVTQLPIIKKYSKVIAKSDHNIHLVLENSDPLILEFNKGAGTIFYFSTLLDLKWSDLPIKGLLIPLIYRMLIFTGTDNINSLPIIIDDSKWISIKEEDLRKKWEVKSPNGSTILIIPDFDKEGILIDQTGELGFYDVFFDDEIFTSFPTRLNNQEFIKPMIDQSVIENHIDSKNIRWLKLDDNFKNKFSEIRHGKSLWKIFLYIILIMVLIETFLGKPDIKRTKK